MQDRIDCIEKTIAEMQNTFCHANCRKNSEKVLIYASLVLSLSHAFTAPFPLP